MSALPIDREAIAYDLLWRRDPRVARRIILRADGCWIYAGAYDSNGYGNVRRDRKNVGVHRYVYGLLGHTLVPGLVLDHLCEVRACANPYHLDQVRQRANSLRSDGVSSRNLAKTHCPANHVYDEANTYYGADGSRRCRACNREYVSRKRAALPHPDTADPDG